MQISSRTRDFIVDTLKLRNLIGPYLREIFANPQIKKVLHGSDYDIEWLQKDFGIYVVNLFDTGQAGRVLQLKSFSLAFLLQNYCNVIADKKYQLADWRQRPIPEEMCRYAREDTHYLLYVYDVLQQELLDKGFQINSNNPHQFYKLVLHKSNALCLKSYEKPQVKDVNYYMIISRNKTLQSRAQFSLLKALIKWRDYIARLEDESPGYVMPNHLLFAIGNSMPGTMNELRDCCRSTMTSVIMKYQDELVAFVNERVTRARSKQVNTHVKFDSPQTKAAAKKRKDSSSSSSSSSSDEDVHMVTKKKKMQVIEIVPEPIAMPTAFTFSKEPFQSFDVKLNHSTVKSSMYKVPQVESKQIQVSGKTSKKKQTPRSLEIAERPQKIQQELEIKRKVIDDKLEKLSYYDLLKTLTGQEGLKIITDHTSTKKNQVEESEIRKLLGKRGARDVTTAVATGGVDEDENPVA